MRGRRWLLRRRVRDATGKKKVAEDIVFGRSLGLLTLLGVVKKTGSHATSGPPPGVVRLPTSVV